MKKVLALIAEKQQEYSRLPLFKFMQDSRISPLQRLAFAPCFAHFVMSFRELNHYVFREEPTNNKLQQLINQHTYEDANHWVWFLEDLEKLGMDSSLRFSDVLRFLWGEETKVSRLVTYQLHECMLQASSVQRYVVIEAIEATGNVFLSECARVVEELESQTHRRYRYFGHHHLRVETGRVSGSYEADDLIDSIQLTEAEEKRCFELVENVFSIFADMKDALWRYARSHTVDQALNSTSTFNRSNASRKPSVLVSQASATQNEEGLLHLRVSKRLGSYLVEAGLLTTNQLEEALNDQQETIQPLGELIAKRGWIQQQTIEYMMEKVVLPERERLLTKVREPLSMVS